MLEGGWQWVANHVLSVTTSINTRRRETADSNPHIHSISNDAAHGSVDEVLGASTLSQYAIL